MLNRINRGAVVRTSDGQLGQVHQVVVGPDTNELTHVVVKPDNGGDLMMIPAELIQNADSDAVTLSVDNSYLASRAGDLRYDPSQFDTVDPAGLDQTRSLSTSGHPVVTEAERDAVELSSSDATPQSAGSTVGGGLPGSTTSQSHGTTMTMGTVSASGSGQPVDSVNTSGAQVGGAAASPGTLNDQPVSYPQGTGEQRKGKSITGLPVLSFAEGEKIGTVKDILFDPEQNRVIALLTDEGGWFKSARVIPWTNLKTVGPDSIIVPDRHAEIKADSDTYIKRIMEGDNILSGTRVYTEDGRDLGTIGDMYLDDSTGEVTGYEVSGGVLKATLQGKKFMPAPETLTVGRDVAYVPSAVGDAMQAQTGGLQGAAQSAASSASDTLNTAKEKVSATTAQQERSYVLGKTVRTDVTSDSGEVLVPAGTTISELDIERVESRNKLHSLFLAAGGGHAGDMLDSVKTKTGELTERASAASAERRDQQLQSSIGKTVGRDVYADDGTAVGLKGTIVDYGTLERARTYGKENQLLAAVGAASAQETLGGAKESVSGAIGSLKAKFDEMSTRQEENREQRRIEHALGRPVTRVILDQDDNVLLDTGQIVTHKAVEQARSSGVLNILLDSVYDETPDLSPESLRSGQSGQASLPASLEQQKPENPKI